MTARRPASLLVPLLAALVAALVAYWPLTARAADAVPTENDKIASSRAVKLTENLRCLVCQNQTIAESNAELALDLRRQVREQIAAGKTDQEILDYMVNRYGDFVLYNPPVKPATLLLWGGPALLFVIGAGVIFLVLRGRRRMPAETPLTAEERSRAAALLAGGVADAPASKKESP
jgi:cytochrome c-type biogenesis protein CcmH